jgi:Pyridoxamine 5'-phosphate oxidase
VAGATLWLATVDREKLWTIPGLAGVARPYRRTTVPTLSAKNQEVDSMPIAVSKIRDVADGVQAGQFEVGERSTLQNLGDLDAVYRELLDGPVTPVISVTGGAGRSNLSPVWFDYEGDRVLLNLAAHRKKVHWLRENPQATFLLMNPGNPYHWISIKATVARQIAEDDPVEGARVTKQLDRMAAKYLGEIGGYALRDPSRSERRVWFEFGVDSWRHSVGRERRTDPGSTVTARDRRWLRATKHVGGHQRDFQSQP